MLSPLNLPALLQSELRRFWRLVPASDKLLFRAGGSTAGLATAVLLLHSCIIQPVQQARKSAEVKQNLHAIQLALERFAVDSEDSRYPLNTAELITTAYLPALPRNPYTGAPMREHSIDTPQLPPGDFVYYPRYGSTGSRPIGYTLATGERGLQSLRDYLQRQR